MKKVLVVILVVVSFGCNNKNLKDAGYNGHVKSITIEIYEAEKKFGEWVCGDQCYQRTVTKINIEGLINTFEDGKIKRIYKSRNDKRVFHEYNMEGAEVRRGELHLNEEDNYIWFWYNDKDKKEKIIKTYLKDAYSRRTEIDLIKNDSVVFEDFNRFKDGWHSIAESGNKKTKIEYEVLKRDSKKNVIDYVGNYDGDYFYNKVSFEYYNIFQWLF